MITKEALRQAINKASEAIRNREREFSVAQTRLAEAERELKLLSELAQLRGWEPDDTGHLHQFPSSSEEGAMGGRRRVPSPARTALLGVVIDILAERGEPMQIRELMKAVQGRGVAIPGSGQQANLIAHISRDDRIARPRRGFYALREWGVEDSKHAARHPARPRPGAKT